MAPELLPYQFKLVKSVLDAINKQEQAVSGKAKDNDDRFYFNIHKMELERVKYLLKNYLRTRLFKIEKFYIYLIEKDQAHLMHESEMNYVWKLYESKKNYFN